MSSSSSTEDPSQVLPLIEAPSMSRGNGNGRDPSMSTAQRASNASNQIPPTQNPTGGGAHFQNAQFTGGGHAFGANSIVNNIRSGENALLLRLAQKVVSQLEKYEKA
ncbi:hypothetical protein JOM56_001705 [Amanita muscaria]